MIFEDVYFDINDVTTYPIFLMKVIDKNYMRDSLIGFRYLSVKIKKKH